jgi:hypothetical protein
MRPVPPQGPRHRSRGEHTGQRESGALAVTAQIQRRARGGPPDPGRCSGRAARQGHAGCAGCAGPWDSCSTPGQPPGRDCHGRGPGRRGLARTRHAAGQDPPGPGEGRSAGCWPLPARSVTAGDNTVRSPPGPDALRAPLHHRPSVIFHAKSAGARWVRTAVLRAGDLS